MLPSNIKDLVILIDKGHTVLNGGNVGAIGYLNESKENREVGDRLIAKLRSMGATVIDVSCDYASNLNQQLNGITNKANQYKAHIFLSLHLNAGRGTGAELFTINGSGVDGLAKQLINTYCSELGIVNRGHKHANFHVLRETIMPAMLIELIFVDNERDKAKWDSLSYDQIVNAIIKGLGYSVGNSNPTPPPTTNKSEFKVGNYGGSVVVTADVLNVRSGRGSEHNIIGQVYNGNTLTVNYILNDNRDGSGNDDLWGSINFKGMTGFIHLGYTKPTTQSVPTPPPVIEEPKPTPPSCDTELNRYSENGRCTIVANSGIRFRDKPCTCHGVQQGIYGCGESVSYDLVVITEKYIWISWIGASSGARRYMPIKDKNTNERWGNCV